MNMQEKTTAEYACRTFPPFAACSSTKDRCISLLSILVEYMIRFLRCQYVTRSNQAGSPLSR
jgi:hypothetical protein